MSNNHIYVIGCGGHARSIADSIIQNNDSITFVDEFAKDDEKILGFECTNNFNILTKAKNIFVGIGDNIKREEYFSLYNPSINIISPKAYIGSEVKLGKGIFIATNAYLGVLSSIDDDTIINTNAIIEHECTIGKHTHISVNTTICGRCSIGDFVFIGAGSVVIDKISICSNVIIGAGSTVIRDITESGTYIGSPCKKISDRKV